MAAGVLSSCVAKASAGMVLLPWNIPVIMPEGLSMDENSINLKHNKDLKQFFGCKWFWMYFFFTEQTLFNSLAPGGMEWNFI